jgi:hypothetical protein
LKRKQTPEIVGLQYLQPKKCRKDAGRWAFLNF